MAVQFFTFEGGEGSGKSTQAKLLAKVFENNKIEAILTREPGGTESAEVIRNLLLHSEAKFYPITELLLLNASRYEHAKSKIIPALRAKKMVVCDRFVDSTMAYQGYGHKLGKKMPALLHNVLMEGLVPDITFVLDIDPKEGLLRASVKSEHDNYEKLDLDFHNRVRNGFLEIANMAKDRCVLIQSGRNIFDIHQEIVNVVNTAAELDLKPASQL
jgi:dTMP kinase